jgi:outer membrane protein OmpA-like peptidoglycan-associated protein
MTQLRHLFTCGLLALALTGCTRETEAEPDTSTTAGAETMNDMPDDGVNERPTDSPAQVTTGTRADGDDNPEMIQVDPMVPGSAIVVDIERLEEVCADPAVYFDTDEATLSQNAKETIAYLAECIRNHDVRSVHITGHADERGSASYNERLGRARAERVAQQLKRHGVTEPEVRVESMGEQASRYSLFWPVDRRVTIDTQPSG